MQEQNNPKNKLGGLGGKAVIKNRETISQLAQSGEAQKLMSMLQQRGGVKEAAQAAAQGDPSQLMSMMNQIMNTAEGAQLIENIGAQAKQAGLE